MFETRKTENVRPSLLLLRYYRAQLKHADSSVNESVEQLKRKYLKNEALALARAGLKHNTAALFNLAISRFTELMGTLPSTSAFKKELAIITSHCKVTPFLQRKYIFYQQ